MQFVEVSFPVLGRTVAIDHAHALYAALSLALPRIHDPASPIAIASIAGRPCSDGRLAIASHSRLTLRLPAEQFGEILPLAGRQIAVGNSHLSLGVPHATLLQANPTLFARMVAIRCASSVGDPEYPRYFVESACKLVSQAGIEGKVSIARSSKEGCLSPRRRVIRIRGCTIVGYSVRIEGLSDPDSMALQANWRDHRSIFGRRKFGCAFFISRAEAGA